MNIKAIVAAIANPSQSSANVACVDAPLWMQEVFERWIARVQVLPCVRPMSAATTAAGLYGDRGSGPARTCALEALGHFPGFPDPVF
jgi:hypothetical protein